MYQLLYRSFAHDHLESGSVFQIIETSARNNPDRGITGFLIFVDDTFLQLVEGSEEALDTLLADLADDPRHHSIEILARDAIATRSFPSWRMERISPAEARGDTFLAKLADAGVALAARRALGEFFERRKAA